MLREGQGRAGQGRSWWNPASASLWRTSVDAKEKRPLKIGSELRSSMTIHSELAGLGLAELWHENLELVSSHERGANGRHGRPFTAVLSDSSFEDYRYLKVKRSSFLHLFNLSFRSLC